MHFIKPDYSTVYKNNTEMRMIMNDLYVISGVTGMTGNELVRQIIGEQRGSVIGFDNFFCSSLDTVQDVIDSDFFDFYQYDINNTAQMSEIEYRVLQRKHDFDRVIYINCAAVVHTEYFYHINTTFDTNVLGMKLFLQQAISVGAYAYINCSTSEVYSMKSFSEDGVKESDYILLADAEHSQRTSYATGKLLTEFFMKDAVDNHQIKGCSLRFANVYSKNEKFAKHILPHIITSLMEHGEVTLLENSKKNKRTFLHNIDSCAAVLALIDAPDALDGSVYNVATDEEIAITDLVSLCAEKLGIQNAKIHFEGYRESDPERRLLNIDKIKSKTCWSPKITLSAGIEMIVDYHKGAHEL